MSILHEQNNTIRCNWFLPTAKVLKALGLAPVQGGQDWEHINTFTFGELAHDYEEGLCFETTPDKIGELVKFVRAFHIKHEAPFILHSKSIGDFYAFCAGRNDHGVPDFVEEFKAAGLVQDEEFDFDWNLTE